MIETVNNARSAPAQTQEGLQQIHQQLVSISRTLSSFEDFGEKLDTIEDRLLNAEQGIGQLGFMLQQIGQ
eukprot:4648548-Pyramimonas_sp.AAC.1